MVLKRVCNLKREFGKESARINKRTLYLKSRRKAKMEKEIDGYINWICKAEESILSAENTSDLYKRHILESIKIIYSLKHFEI